MTNKSIYWLLAAILLTLLGCGGGGGGSSTSSSTNTPPSTPPALPDPAATALVSSYVSSTSNQERTLFVSENQQLSFDMARRGLHCGSAEQDGFNALVSSHTTTLTHGLKAYIIQINGQYLLNKQDIRSVIESSRASDLLYYDGYANFSCPPSSNIPAFRQRVSQTINALYDSIILSLSGFAII